eukprot:14275_1
MMATKPESDNEINESSNNSDIMTTTDTKSPTSESNKQSHPGYIKMIKQAIVSLNGYATCDEISNYIANNWKCDKYKIINGSRLTNAIKRNLNKPAIFNIDNKTKKYNIIIMKQSIPPFGDKECGRNAVYVNG